MTIGERVAKFVTEHRQEFVLATVQISEGVGLPLPFALYAGAFRDVIKAIDRAGDLSVRAFQRADIHDHGNARTVGPFDEHFRITHLQDFSAHHLGHGTLLMRHETAVRTEQPERATKPLVGIAQCRFAAPQFRGDAIEFLNHTRGIDGIDGDRTQVEQDAVTFLALAQRFVIPKVGIGH